MMVFNFSVLIFCLNRLGRAAVMHFPGNNIVQDIPPTERRVYRTPVAPPTGFFNVAYSRTGAGIQSLNPSLPVGGLRARSTESGVGC